MNMSIYNPKTYTMQLPNTQTTRSYRIGDTISKLELGLNYETLTDCDNNYSIFPYQTDDYVLFISNGVFSDAVHYTELKDDFIFGLPCYDANGNELNLECVRDYITLREKFIMLYEVKAIAHDYGIYREETLLCILHTKENALLIKDILESDFKKENYKKDKVIKTITKAMKRDEKKCVEQNYDGDCSSCCCSVCIIQ